MHQKKPAEELLNVFSRCAVPAAANPASDEAFKVAANIKYHATYTPAYNPLKFTIPQAYRATAQSLRDTLIQRWNDTYALFQEKDPKQTYYLSMEFLQVSSGCQLFHHTWIATGSDLGCIGGTCLSGLPGPALNCAGGVPSAVELVADLVRMQVQTKPLVIIG